MKILAIDTSLTSVSACVFDGQIPRMLASECIEMSRGHAEALLPLVERVITATPGGFAALDRVAVTVGPGSFTGIRVGVSAAIAIGIALEIPVVGVSTLAAFAAPLVMEGGDSVIIAAIDARHGHLYLHTLTPSGKTILPAQILSEEEAGRRIGKGPFRLAGPGCANIAIQAWLNYQVVYAEGELKNPLIEFVARLGLRARPELAPPVPLYLKAVDALPAAPAHPGAG